jgi:hypothetical protein
MQWFLKLRANTMCAISVLKPLHQQYIFMGNRRNNQ